MKIITALFVVFSSLLVALPQPHSPSAKLFMPTVSSDWWTVAHDPDLADLTDPKQQPVDFAVWQAADGSWQLWSCIRSTKERGNTRLFHRWEGRKLTDRDWKPLGIAMRAEEKFGETLGGLQAPFVVKIGALFQMFYGDLSNICAATSADGKTFARRLKSDGRAGMFDEGERSNTRDPMAIKIKGLWHLYYTANPNRKGAIYSRTSKDAVTWSPSWIVSAGGRAGDGSYSAECPYVVELEAGHYYLFRTQRYGQNALTNVYYSTDPLDFGVNQDDRTFVGALPLAAPEIIRYQGKYFIASLLPSLKGIQIARLEWKPLPGSKK